MDTTFDGYYTDAGTLVVTESLYEVRERDTPFVHELPHVSRQFKDEDRTVLISVQGIHDWLHGKRHGPSDDDRRDVDARRTRQRLDLDHHDLQPPQLRTVIHCEAAYNDEADDELTDDETNQIKRCHDDWVSVYSPMVPVEDDGDSPHHTVDQNTVLSFRWCGERVTENEQEMGDSEELFDDEEELPDSNEELHDSEGLPGEMPAARGTREMLAEVVRDISCEQAREFLDRLLANPDDEPIKDVKDDKDGSEPSSSAWDMPYSPTIHRGGSPGWALGPLIACGDPRWHCESWGED